MTLSGIPTKYNATQFRSRLEARWAAFFDLLGWNWDYEPCDCNGWIPDFILHGSTPTLVEIKPITALCDDTAQKIYRADTTGFDLLLLGLGPQPSHDRQRFAYEPDTILGWLCQRGAADMRMVYDGDEPRLDENGDFVYETSSYAYFHEAHLTGPGTCPEHPTSYDFYDTILSFVHNICGAYDGNSYAYAIGFGPVERLWREAGNRVQWKAPK